ncbi:hypothetical protein P4B35_01225 [Pontiellaceae bacterium B12227]|nr:hypothetical protein [Pontiellaceae bacterium B12227]
MNVKYILSGCILLSCVIAAESRTFSFSEAEGFKAGLLDGQNGWVSELNTVTPQTKGYIELSKTQWKTGFFEKALPADETRTYKMSSVVSFSETSDQGNNDVMSFIFNNQMNGKGTARCFISRVAGNGYKIGFKGVKEAQNDTLIFPSERIGITAGNCETDQLRFTYALTKGATSKDWKVELLLENLRTGKIVASLVKEHVETTHELFDATELYAGFSSSRTDDVTGTTNRRIHTIDIQEPPGEETLFLLLSLRSPTNRLNAV